MAILVDFSDKVALITGASRGIGLSIAKRFHEAGARVVINHPGGEEMRALAEAASAELNAIRPDSSLAAEADVSKPDRVLEMMNLVRERFGGVDHLVNNAGILRDRTIAKMSVEEWREVLDVNLSGVFFCCKYGLEAMRDGGAIVNVGSLSADAGFVGQSNYSAAKAGVHALTRVLGKECARRSIRVNAIAPGVIDTDMAATIPETIRAEMRKRIPALRFGTALEVADGVVFLCSPLASYVNGHVLKIDGGWRG